MKLCAVFVSPKLSSATAYKHYSAEFRNWLFISKRAKLMPLEVGSAKRFRFCWFFVPILEKYHAFIVSWCCSCCQKKYWYSIIIIIWVTGAKILHFEWCALYLMVPNFSYTFVWPFFYVFFFRCFFVYFEFFTPCNIRCPFYTVPKSSHIYLLRISWKLIFYAFNHSFGFGTVYTMYTWHVSGFRTIFDSFSSPLVFFPFVLFFWR